MPMVVSRILNIAPGGGMGAILGQRMRRRSLHQRGRLGSAGNEAEPWPIVISGDRHQTQARQPSYSGAFAAAERAYLDTCFGACSIALVARSRHDTGLALIHWQAVAAMVAGGQPLSTAPTAAYYVLDCSGEGEPRLERIDDSRQLEARYPDHFPPMRIRRPWTQTTLGVAASAEPQD